MSTAKKTRSKRQPSPDPVNGSRAKRSASPIPVSATRSLSIMPAEAVDLYTDGGEVGASWDDLYEDDDLWGSRGSRPPIPIARDPDDRRSFVADVEFDDDAGGDPRYTFRGAMIPLRDGDRVGPLSFRPVEQVVEDLPLAFRPPPSIPVRDASDIAGPIDEDLRQLLWFEVDGGQPQKRDIYKMDADDIDDAVAPADAVFFGELLFVVKMLRHRLVELFRAVQSDKKIVFLFGFSESIENTQIYTDRGHLQLFPETEADAIIQVYIPTYVDLASKISFEDLTNTLVEAIAQLTGVSLPTVAREIIDLDLESAISYILAHPDVLKDRRVSALLAAEGVRVETLSRTFSRDATLILLGGRGAERVPVTYQIKEAFDLIPSNHYESFAANPKYPRGWQERDYSGDPTEKLKVAMNAQNFDPVFAVNTNPDAMNGPPIVTPSNFVLGGNSRTMSMQMVYARFPERARALKAYLLEYAPVFGLTEADVRAVDHPVLVRTLTDVDESDDAKMRIFVRQMNEGHSQKMTADVEGRALAQKLSIESIRKLGDGIMGYGDDEQLTLREFMGERSDALTFFIESLRDDGVITATNVNMWIDGNAEVFSGTAIALFESVLLGKLFSDTQKLANMPAALKRSLITALPLFLGVSDPERSLKSLSLAVDSYILASSYFRPRDSAAVALDAVQRLWVDTAPTNINGTEKEVIYALLADAFANRLLVILIVFNGPRKLATVFGEIAAISKAQEDQVVEDMFSTRKENMTAEEKMEAFVEGVDAYLKSRGVPRTHFDLPRANAGRRGHERTTRGLFAGQMRRAFGGRHLHGLISALESAQATASRTSHK